MNELVITDKSDGIGIHTTSLIVAEVFGKDHKNVLQSIQQLEVDEEFRALNFQLSSYQTLQNKSLSMYLITKDGFSFLVMGYTGEKAAKFKLKFIRAFNQMTALINDDDAILDRGREILEKRLKLLKADYENQAIQLNTAVIKLETQAPVVEYANKVLSSTSHLTVQQIAKELKTTAVKLNLFLAFHGIQFKQKKGDIWLLYEKYSKLDWTFEETFTREQLDGSVKTFHHTYWTEKGRLAIHTLWKNETRSKPIRLGISDGVSQLKLEV